MHCMTALVHIPSSWGLFSLHPRQHLLFLVLLVMAVTKCSCEVMWFWTCISSLIRPVMLKTSFQCARLHFCSTQVKMCICALLFICIFSSIGLLLHFGGGFLCCTEDFQLGVFPLVYVCLLPVLLMLSLKSSARPVSRTLLPVFPSKCLMASWLMFKTDQF